MKKLVLLLCLISPSIFAQGPLAVSDTGESFIIQYKKEYLSQEVGFQLHPDANLMLFDTISTWLGTPYRFAGNCEKGIDCSGFVTVLFNRVYGKKIGARNSAEMYDKLVHIKKGDIKEGDLVFFKTSRRRISHVGLYLGENKFVHASTSNGVIISNLDEIYYKNRYAGAGRWENEIVESNEK
ncbi:MAG: C40 family peptidase [Bacteroidetes bacterium]|nr:C40 family peptidase [Bacteroidota bacterium]